MSADTMRASLRLIAQVCAEVTSAPTFSHASMLARIHTIAHLALIKEPAGVVVNLAEAEVDLGILRTALRLLRLELDPNAAGADPARLADVDRLTASIDAAQAAMGAPWNETPVIVGVTSDGTPVVSVDGLAAPGPDEDDFGGPDV